MVCANEMASEIEKVLCRGVYGEEPLRERWRLEPSHCPFPQSCLLVGALDPIVGIARDVTERFGHYVSVRYVVAREFVGNDAARPVPGSLENPPEEPFRCGRVAFFGEVDVDDLTVLVDGSPKVAPDATDSDEDFVDEAGIPETRMRAPQALSVPWTELLTSCANGFVAD